MEKYANKGIKDIINQFAQADRDLALDTAKYRRFIERLERQGK